MEQEELERLKFCSSNGTPDEQVWYSKVVCVHFAFIVCDYEINGIFLSTSYTIQFNEETFWQKQEPSETVIKVFSFLRPHEFADAISHFRLFSFSDGLRYRLYLLNVKFRRIMLYCTSFSNQDLTDFAGVTFIWKCNHWKLPWKHQPDFLLIYRRPVRNLTT